MLAPTHPQEQLPANSFWLRSVRILCACTLLAILVPWSVMLLRDSNGSWSGPLVLLLALVGAPCMGVVATTGKSRLFHCQARTNSRGKLGSARLRFVLPFCIGGA